MDIKEISILNYADVLNYLTKNNYSFTTLAVKNAIVNNHVNYLRSFLKSDCPYKVSYLYIAVIKNRPECLKILLKSKQNIKDIGYYKLISYAKNKQYHKCLEYLYKYNPN